EPNGYFVLCKDAALFKKYYGIDADGVFTGALSHGGDRVDLLDGQGQRIDSVKNKTRAPWPVAPDGSSSSPEPISPTPSSARRENWAPSPLPKGPPKPGGTPGRRNANFAERLPPDISHAVFPNDVAPGEEIKFDVELASSEGVKTVELLWRIAGTNYESKE